MSASLFQWCVIAQSWLDDYDTSQNPGKISNSSLLTENGITEILLDKKHGKDFGLISPKEWYLHFTANISPLLLLVRDAFAQK